MTLKRLLLFFTMAACTVICGLWMRHELNLSAIQSGKDVGNLFRGVAISFVSSKEVVDTAQNLSETLSGRMPQVTTIANQVETNQQGVQQTSPHHCRNME